jgi:hypothetical protein
VDINPWKAATAVLAAILIAGASFAAGHLTGQAAPRTAAKAVPGPGPGETVTCFASGGRAWLSSPGAGIAPVNGCSLTFSPVYPLSSGEVTFTLTAPDGSSSRWVSPSG